MTPHVRRAGSLDTKPMARLLNQIIAAGGTTAITAPVTDGDLRDWIQTGGAMAAWHLAENDGGTLLGFQWIEPHPDLPSDACDIATFVQIGRTGLGIGSRLFDATRHAANSLGYSWINATIRADNSGGLAYYQSRGFEDYARLEDGRICKRYDL